MKLAAPTMDDVARAAGCSRATVSLALRSHRSIPESTRRKIVATATRLGYRTNPLVSALMSLHRRTRPASSAGMVVGYLTSHAEDNPWRSHTAYLGMFRGVIERGEELGYKVDEFNLAARGMNAARMRQILAARNIHALIVAPLPHEETTINFDFASLAVVGLGMSVHEPAIERVANDHFQSAALAVDRCVALGYRRIGLVLSRETSVRLDNRWLAGYEFAIAHHNTVVPVPPLMTAQSSELLGALPDWLQERKPDVVILDNSYPEYLRRVPVNVGVVSLSVDRPNDAVSGIFQNYELLGRVAFEHAAAKLYTNSFGPLNEPHLHLVAGTWVAGTTAPGPGRRRAAGPTPGKPRSPR